MRSTRNWPLWFALALGFAPVPAQANQSLIRLESLLSQADIQGSPASTNVSAAEPIVWQGFYSADAIPWEIARGRIGVRNGDLVVKGEGATPVILAPKEPAIDWKLYNGLEIRMSAQAGSEIKIKIGDFEAKQKLGPTGQYNVYRFDFDINAPKGGRILGIMPTDSVTEGVAIHSIKLIPKPAQFTKAAGLAFTLGKRDEYRNVIYLHSPVTISFPVTVPQNGFLHFGMGIAAKDAPVKFEVSVSGVAGEMFSKVITDPEVWDDGAINLARWSGKKINLQLRTESEHAGAVALWANPILSSSKLPALPNVLIYTVDTLRADHASLYHYQRDTTPFLSKFGANGVVFEDCQAQSTWTKSSIASMMTSLYSFTHGIMNDSGTIPPGAATIAEQLREAGYVTASIVASPFVGRSTGLERGFDYLMEFPVIRRQRNARTDGETDSGALNRVIFPWLDRHHDEPFFLYAHSTDPHAPYGPPPPFDAKFANPAQNAEFNRNYARFRTNHEYGGGAMISPEMCQKAGINGNRFLGQAVDRYDAEVLHNDYSFELLIDKLKQLGVLDNTLIIVMSDHGEEFWDHGWTAHGHTVYQELTHAVLLLWNPSLLPTPRRVKEPVQLIDVMPTIFDLLKLKAPPIMEGQSLEPLARGHHFQRSGLVIASRFAAAQPIGLVPENATDSFAIIDEHWKFIYRNKSAHTGAKKVELYDRSSDRAERHDVSGEHPDLIQERTAALSQWIQAQNKIRSLVGHPGQSSLDQQTIDRLRSLGYLGGSPR